MDTNGILAIDTSEQILHLPIKRRQTVLEMLIERGITQISSPCGGNGLCGKCLVLVTSFDGAGPTDDEKRLLTESQLRAGYRLACRMQIGPESKLSIRLLKKSEQAQVISSYYTQARFEQPDSYDQECYGCAIDIGTTSVVVYLIRLDTHELVGHSAQMNVQKAYGADVISRIQFCNDHEKGLHILQSMIVGQLDAMIERVAKEYKVPLSLVSRIVVVGNPTMIHLLTGTDPSSIASAPFTPAFVDQKILLANDVGLACTPSAQLVLPGFVSAYIGSDITVGVHASQLKILGKVVLYIDIGTNGEIVLWDGDTLCSCSSAAGPAFEGASIKHGMAATAGAVDSVYHEYGVLSHTTIAGEEAIGLCGSAIIDCVALLLDLQLIDETGAMAEDDQLLVDTPDGKALKITETVYFTNRDVREVQLAKAAIAAGIETLLAHAHLGPEDLDAVVIAGGFGFSVNKDNAIRIGLLPSIAVEKILVVGNAAIRGAQAILMSGKTADEVERLRKDTQYIELSLSQAFQERYIEHMMFQ